MVTVEADPRKPHEATVRALSDMLLKAFRGVLRLDIGRSDHYSPTTQSLGKTFSDVLPDHFLCLTHY